MEVLNVSNAPGKTANQTNQKQKPDTSHVSPHAVPVNELDAFLDEPEAHSTRMAVANTTPDGIDFAAMVEASAEMNDMEVVLNLTAEYIQLNAPGDKFRGIYYGMTEITVNDQNTGEQKTLPAAQFIVNRQMRINGGAVLVNEILRSKVQPGTPVEIKFERQESRVKIYSVSLLGGK